LQHILAITELPQIDFWCYLPGKPGLHLLIERDAAYIDRLLLAEEKFWHEVLSLCPQ
jgi:hypothetical protein